MSVALTGNLRDFGIAEVFQLIGQQRKTGLLEISADQHKMRLAFDAGAVVWAAPVGSSEHAMLGDRLVRSGLITQERLSALAEESATSARPLPSLLVSSGSVNEVDLDQISELLTQETIFEVMRWTEGSFHFSAQTIHHSQPAERLLAAEQILMDGLRKLDEWRTFADKVPADDVVFQQVGEFDVYREQARGEVRNRLPQAERVVSLVDGRLTTRRIIDLSRLGTFEATRILAELVAAGVIGPIESMLPSKGGRSELRLQPVVEGVGTALAAAFPIALLSLMVCLTFGLIVPPKAPSRGFSIERAPFAEARQTFEKLRLRQAIHAQRYLTGDWPETLQERDSTGLLGSDTLTPETGAPYYYERSDAGVSLLAPQR